MAPSFTLKRHSPEWRPGLGTPVFTPAPAALRAADRVGPTRSHNPAVPGTRGTARVAEQPLTSRSRISARTAWSPHRENWADLRSAQPAMGGLTT